MLVADRLTALRLDNGMLSGQCNSYMADAMGTARLLSAATAHAFSCFAGAIISELA